MSTATVPHPHTAQETTVVTDDLALREAAITTLESEVGVLMRRVRRVIADRARLVHPDLQPTSYLILTTVLREGTLRASTLVESLDVDKGAVSRQVKHLVELGLLAGEPDPEDGRAIVLSATDEARRRIEVVGADRRRYVQERLAGWDTDKLEGFVRDLAGYNALLEASAD
ncbi:MAG: MarR family transcriptional regulator [Nocardioides sp.]|nr:MarR family transcriptional regulator [Nocardioides sp.]